ncbi:MAG: FadR family transcriptional regulator [Alphaproteobacteria bacterium]|nr:FadR family transcriptional regulator [Alphaproteobacteria bacterium]
MTPLKPAERRSTADQVFDQLARAILEGEWAPGDALPAERVIAEQVGCSRIIVRQAVHRLADLKLVETRQGGATLVNDPWVGEVGVVELMLRLTPTLSPRFQREVYEEELLAVLVPLVLAGVHATDAQRRALLALVDAEPHETLEDRFFEVLSDISGNRVEALLTRWWTRLRGLSPDPYPVPPKELRAFLRRLAEALVERRDPVPLYLAEIRPLLALLRA